MEQGLYAFSYHGKSWAPESNCITGFIIFRLWSVEPYPFNALDLVHLHDCLWKCLFLSVEIRHQVFDNPHPHDLEPLRTDPLFTLVIFMNHGHRM